MNDKKYNINDEDEINFGEALKFLLRNTTSVLIFSLVGLIIAYIAFNNSKRIWKGEFQIVLEKEDTKSSSIIQSLIGDDRVSGFASNVGLNTKNKKLETEVEILRSPLVLFPIYDYVKQLKRANNRDFGLSYNMWYRSSISVKLKRGTSVLNFTYTDTDKDIIIPTLTEISKKYQSYSDEEKERSLDKGLDYLQKQITKYEKITADSAQELQSFSYKHNLISNFDEEESLTPASEIERVKAENKLNLIEKQIKQINEIPKGSNTILPLAKRIYTQNNIKISGPLRKIDDINERLISNKNIYKDTDPLIIDLVNVRNSSIMEIRNELINDLNAEKNSLKVLIEANTKPKDVIFKYTQLLRASADNAKILVGLKTNQSTLVLKKAEINDPWKLITKPTLADFPVGPTRRTISLVGLIIGSLLGIIFAFIKEKVSEEVYSKNEIDKLLEIPFIDEINLKDKENTKEIIKLLLLSKLNIQEEETLAIVPIGNIKEEFLLSFVDIIQSYMTNNKIAIVQNLSEAKDFSCQLFLASIEETKTNEIKNINKLLNLQNHKTIGWILLSNKDFKKS